MTDYTNENNKEDRRSLREKIREAEAQSGTSTRRKPTDAEKLDVIRAILGVR